MVRQRHRIKAAIALAVALSAIAAALLITSYSTSRTGRDGNLARAAYVSSNVPGYQIAMRLTGNAAGQPINATGTGAFDQTTHDGRLTMNMTLPIVGGQNFQIDVVTLGKNIYLKPPAALAGKIPGGKPWLELNLSGIGKDAGFQRLSSLVANPGESAAQFLQFLRAASTGSVQNLGQQTIDGVSTTGLRATVDLSKVVGTLPATQQESASPAIAVIEKLTGLHYLPIEAWVDSSNHIRRILVSETGHVDGQPFSENVRLDFVKYGPEPAPAAPPADEVTNIMSLVSTL